MKKFLKLALAAVLMQVSVAKAQESTKGSLWLTQKGELNVLWDGGSVSLPSLTLDLQKLLGEKWMEAVQIKVSSGTYNKDPLKEVTDIKIGEVSLSLSQKISISDAWQISLREEISGSPYFQRKFLETSSVFKAVPINFAFDTQVVHHFSQSVAASLAIGIYESIIHSLSNSDVFKAKGGYVNPQITINNQVAIGANFNTQQLKTNDATNITAYVQYALSKANVGKHTLRLQLSTYNDSIVRHADGTPHKSKKLQLQYSVRF